MTSLTEASQQSLKELIEDREEPAHLEAANLLMVSTHLPLQLTQTWRWRERYGDILADNERMLYERERVSKPIEGLGRKTAATEGQL